MWSRTRRSEWRSHMSTICFFIISSIAVHTPDSEISNLLAVGTTFTGSGNLYCQWELSPDIVMSDSEDSTVTYMEVSSPFEDMSDIGPPGVDGLPMMPQDPYAYVEAALQAPPSPDYVSGPEEPEQAPPILEFVLKPAYLEFMPPEDDALPAEEQPLHEDDEDPKEDPADYPTDREDDENEEESSGDDVDDEEEDEDEDEEEEEHPALADSVIPLVHLVTGRMSVQAQTPISPLLDTEILSPPLPISPPPPPTSLTYFIGYEAARIRLKAESPSTSHPLPSSTPSSWTPSLLPIPLPTSSPPFLIPSMSRRSDVLEVTLLPRKRLYIALGSIFEKMAPKRTTRSTPATTTTTTSTPVTNAQLKELALMCARMFPEESHKIERYISGLPDMIHESVMASKPKTMQDAIEFTTKLMDKKISTFVE
nr:hypothetical protein [Tanacetum cinerariifolium]